MIGYTFENYNGELSIVIYSRVTREYMLLDFETNEVYCVANTEENIKEKIERYMK